VDLSKPLLAMFSIKGRTYKVEYEGLHLLCLNCGKFGHYVEGCPKTSVVGGNGGQGGENDRVEKQTQVMGGEVTGPWTVVSKTRRPRKNQKLTEAVTGVRIIRDQDLLFWGRIICIWKLRI
jgi:hypothetical protein